MEFDQSERVEPQQPSANSDTADDDETYTFVFQNNEQEEIRTIPANLLRRYPNCMLSRMVNSLISTRRTSDGGYILKDRNLEMVDHIINFMQHSLTVLKSDKLFEFEHVNEQNEFRLPSTFTKYAALIAEADFYCFQEMKDWLETECKKNSARITFATQHAAYSYVLYIAGDTSVLYDAYMNEEERRSFLSNNMTLAQINNLKLRLQHDRFSCRYPSEHVNENSNDDMKVILMETFSRN